MYYKMIMIHMRLRLLFLKDYTVKPCIKISDESVLDYFRPIQGVALLTEKDLRKLNRYQLLELLVVQTERADRLQSRLEATEKQMYDQDLQIASLGSIAEASLQLGGVFQAAQEAADMYINAAKKQAEEIEQAAYKNAASIIAEAKAQARVIKGE